MGHRSQSTARPAILSAFGTATARPAASTQNNTSDCSALLCAFWKANYTSKPFWEGNWSKFVSFPLSILMKYISHRTSVCVVKDKLCTHCTRTKHGILYKPDSELVLKMNSMQLEQHYRTTRWLLQLEQEISLSILDHTPLVCKQCQ